MDGYENNEEREKKERDEIFSKVVRAGKRTYFLDVKATRRQDYYLTITESKKRFNREGRYFFEKHKVFLYKEDFDKFTDSLQEVIDYIKEANRNVEQQQQEGEESVPQQEETNNKEMATSTVNGYSADVDFEDLDSSID
ncbi:MAG: DUF3276 family protein [Bacteroidales bacterium]|jgi:hypothetical protein